MGKSYEPSMVIPDSPRHTASLPCALSATISITLKLCLSVQQAVSCVFSCTLHMCRKFKSLFCQIVLFSSQHVKIHPEWKVPLFYINTSNLLPSSNPVTAENVLKNVKQILHPSTYKSQLFIHAGDETPPHLVLQISTSKSPHRRWVRKEGMVYNAEKTLCIARAHTALCLGGAAVWMWNALHRSMCLSIWCPVIGAVWGDCGATGCGC